MKEYDVSIIGLEWPYELLAKLKVPQKVYQLYLRMNYHTGGTGAS